MTASQLVLASHAPNKKVLPVQDLDYLLEVMDYKGRAVVLQGIEQSKKDEARFPKGASARETLREKRHTEQQKDCTKVMENLKGKVLEQRDALESSREAYGAKERVIADLTTRLKESDETNVRLTRDCDLLQDDLEKARDEVKSVTTELKKVKESKLVEKLQAQVASGETLVQDLTRERSKLNSRVAALVTEHTHQAAEISALQTDLKEVREHNQKIFTDLSLAEGHNEQLTLQLARLRKEMEELREANATLSQDLAKSEANAGLQQMENQGLKTQLQKLREKAAVVAAAADEMRAL